MKVTILAIMLALLSGCQSHERLRAQERMITEMHAKCMSDVAKDLGEDSAYAGDHDWVGYTHACIRKVHE